MIDVWSDIGTEKASKHGGGMEPWIASLFHASDDVCSVLTEDGIACLFRAALRSAELHGRRTDTPCHAHAGSFKPHRPPWGTARRCHV